MTEETITSPAQSPTTYPTTDAPVGAPPADATTTVSPASEAPVSASSAATDAPVAVSEAPVSASAVTDAPATDAPAVSSAASDGPEAAGESGASSAPPLEDPKLIADIEEAMKDVVDPELGINVVDLGLVYGVHVDAEKVVTLDMTLTSAACPLTDVIEDQARTALLSGPGGGLGSELRINWVWLPPWGPDKITDEGRDQLRALGFNV